MKFSSKTMITAFAVLSVFCASASFADSKETVLKVENQSLNQAEFIQLLANTAGGNAMMVGLMLSQATLQDRVDVASKMADTLVFAQGAIDSGLKDRDDIAFKLKWQAVQTLFEAYLQEASAKWDVSEKTLKDYYSYNKSEFVQVEAAKVRHILTNSEEDANSALLELKNKDFAKVAEEFSRDPNTAQNGGDLGWIEKGTAPEDLTLHIESAEIGKVSKPIKTKIGWEIFEVTERRPEKQLSFKDAEQEVIQRLQLKYVREELERLKKKHKVEINESALENLAGIPAAKPEDVLKKELENKSEKKTD